MGTAKAIFIIVTRNSKAILASCLDSIYNQTNRDFQVAIIDNDSTDGTPEFVRRNYPMAAVVENNRNLGFAKACNQALRLFKAEYAILCNPDIVLSLDWLETMLDFADDPANAEYDCFGGKLQKLKLINVETADLEKTDIIDSCGLLIKKNHRVLEIGAGEPAEKFTETKEVLGFSGALAMYRRSSLEDIILTDKFHSQGDYFDGSFFIYKEDVDLAIRFYLAGHKSVFLPQAIAYHLRTYAAGERGVIRSRRHQSDPARYYSYRNHLLILLEDEYWSNLWRYFFRIAWYELQKFGYVLIFEPKNLRAWLEVISMLPEIRAKRREVLAQAKINPKELRTWYE